MQPGQTLTPLFPQLLLYLSRVTTFIIIFPRGFKATYKNACKTVTLKEKQNNKISKQEGLHIRKFDIINCSLFCVLIALLKTRLQYYNYCIMCIMYIFLALNSLKNGDLIHLYISGTWNNSRHRVSAQYMFVKLN